MKAQELIRILEKCNPTDEITFIFDDAEMYSRNLGQGLHEVSQVNVTGKKINGKIALTNGMTHKLLNGNEESIFLK